MPVDCGETYFTALDEELKYFIIVVLKIQHSGYLLTFDETLISKGKRLFLQDGLSKVLIMSFFLKLNLRYDKIFLGSRTSKENKKMKLASKRIFQV